MKYLLLLLITLSLNADLIIAPDGSIHLENDYKQSVRPDFVDDSNRNVDQQQWDYENNIINPHIPNVYQSPSNNEDYQYNYDYDYSYQPTQIDF